MSYGEPDGHDSIIAIGCGFLAATIAAAIVLGSGPAHSQERPGDFGFHHMENHSWYKDLHDPVNGYSCCNDEDCRPTRAYLQANGTWKALVDGVWRDIPPEIVLKSELNKDPLHAHICASKSGMLYCFIGAGDGG